MNIPVVVIHAPLEILICTLVINLTEFQKSLFTNTLGFMLMRTQIYTTI